MAPRALAQGAAAASASIAAALMQLIPQGKIDLDTPVQK
jgi:CubicO group peptidase (beta-lactamase class C family)